MNTVGKVGNVGNELQGVGNVRDRLQNRKTPIGLSMLSALSVPVEEMAPSEAAIYPPLQTTSCRRLPTVLHKHAEQTTNSGRRLTVVAKNLCVLKYQPITKKFLF